MPYFSCVFLNTDGHFLKREIYAESKKALLAQTALGDEKLISARRRYLKEFSIFKLFGRKIGYHQFLLFNQETVTLLKSGMPLIKALEVISENTKPGRMQDVLKKATVNITSGVQVSEAFDFPELPFHRIYKASLLAGEKSGHLESILEKFNSYLGKMANLRRKTISSLTYPVILLCFMAVMFMVISMYVIPKFSSLYENFEASLPPITIFFIESTAFLKNNIIWFVALLLAVYISVKLMERINPRIIVMDRMKVRIPFIGRVIIENSMAIFARTLSIMVSGGIPVPESSATAVEILSNRFVYSKMYHLPEAIREGNALSDVLRKVDIVPRILLEMIKVGETSGNLATVLDESADYYERAIDNRIGTLISLIEPVIIITLGMVIALMLISVYLPIFSSIKIIQ